MQWWNKMRLYQTKITWPWNQVRILQMENSTYGWNPVLMILIKNRFSIMIDWSVFKNQFFGPIIDFRSYMIDLFIFLWLIFRFFLGGQIFTIHVRINFKIWTGQSKPWDLSVYVWAYRALNTMKSDEIGQ